MIKNEPQYHIQALCNSFFNVLKKAQEKICGEISKIYEEIYDEISVLIKLYVAKGVFR